MSGMSIIWFQSPSGDSLIESAMVKFQFVAIASKFQSPSGDSLIERPSIVHLSIRRL